VASDDIPGIVRRQRRRAEVIVKDIRQLAVTPNRHRPPAQAARLHHLLRAASAFPEPLRRYQADVNSRDRVRSVLLVGRVRRVPLAGYFLDVQDVHIAIGALPRP